MACYVWLNWRRNRLKRSQLSGLRRRGHLSPDSLFHRERREQNVFTSLLKMIPGLEERLMTGSEEEILHIADLVSTTLIRVLHYCQ
jgi:hypothetical protein